MASLKKRNGHLLRTGAVGVGHLVRLCDSPPPGIPCSYCFGAGPMVGGVITFSGVPTSFSSSYFDGTHTHVNTITGFNLNHSRVIDLIQIPDSIHGQLCCWYAPAALVTTFDFKYERLGPTPWLCHQYVDFYAGVKGLGAFDLGNTCDDAVTFWTSMYGQLAGPTGGTPIAGDCSDAGGGQRFDWGSDCTLYPGGTATAAALDFIGVPFPGRVSSQVLSSAASGFAHDSGNHILSSCAWTKTLNCGLGTVTWEPF